MEVRNFTNHTVLALKRIISFPLYTFDAICQVASANLGNTWNAEMIGVIKNTFLSYKDWCKE